MTARRLDRFLLGIFIVFISACGPSVVSNTVQPSPKPNSVTCEPRQSTASAPSNAYVVINPAANGEPGDLDVVSLPSFQVTAFIEIQNQPSMVAVPLDQKFAYVLTGDTVLGGTTPLNSVTVVDLTTKSVSPPFDIGHPQAQVGAMAMTPDGCHLYVVGGGDESAGHTNGFVEEINVNGPALSVGSSISLGDAASVQSQIAISPDGKTALITETGKQTATMIDITRNKVVATVDIPGGITYGSHPIAFAAGSNTAYVVGGGLTAINLTKGQVVASIVVPGSKGLNSAAITPDASTVWVTDDGGLSGSGGVIWPVSLRSGTSGTPIAAGFFPSDIAITMDGRYALVMTPVSTGIKAEILPIDLTTNKILPAVELPASPDVFGQIYTISVPY